MAVATGYSLMVHPALNEGTILIDFFLDLAVRKIKTVAQECYPVVIPNRLPVNIVFVNLTTTRVASGAQLDFALGGSRHAAMRFSSCDVRDPCGVFPFIQRDRQPLVRLFRIARLLRPFDVIGTWAVAGFASYVDFVVS